MSSFDAKILAGVAAFGQSDQIPKEFWAGLSKPLKDCLVVLRKDPEIGLKGLSDALNLYVERLGQGRVDRAKELAEEAVNATPAEGDLLREEYIAAKINTLLQQYLSGEEVYLETSISKMLDGLPIVSTNSVDDIDDIETLLANSGLADDSTDVWGIEAINQFIRPPKRGHFVLLAARPNQGKTTTVMNIVQGTLLNPHSTFRNVLWLNNEGDSGEIRLRSYELALGKTLAELASMGAERVRKAYDEVMGDRSITVKGIHHMTWSTVRRIIENANADIVIVDMLDHLAPVSDARHEALERLYLEMRGHAAVCGYLGIATSQLVPPAPGVKGSTRKPSMDLLKGSRTGKQGATQDIWMLGHDPKHPEYRWLSFPKTKIAKPGSPPDPLLCFKLDRDTGRLVESPEPIDIPEGVPAGGLFIGTLMEDWE